MFRYKKIIPYGLVLFIGLIFFLVKPAFSPARVALQDTSSIILKIINAPIAEFKKILLYHFTYNQNLILKKENADLKNQLVELAELRQENQRLKRLFSFQQDERRFVTAARVVGRDPSSWYSSLFIDKGRKNGIKPNMIVVTAAGLVGKVVEAGNFTSKVLLINDASSSVASLIQRSREQGIISGTITGRCVLHFLPANSDSQISDIVITSGLGEVYPKGLVIGKVVGISEDPGGLSQNCWVEPAVNLATLEEVLIITNQ